MRVALVCGELPSPSAGGIGTVVYFLKKGLEDKGVSVELFCAERFRGSGEKAVYLRQWGVHPVHDISFGLSFKGVFCESQYDVVDFHLPNARGALLYSKFIQIPKVATLHTTSLGYREKVYKRLPYSQLAKNEWRQKAGAINVAIGLEKKSLANADFINCVASNVKEEVELGYGFNNTLSSVKGVPFERDPEFKGGYGGNEDGHYLMVCRLVAQKGIFDVLEAYRALKIQRPLSIVGDGPLRKKIEEFIERHRLPVSLLGFRSMNEMDQVYRSAYALVVPSYYETQPMVAMEAASRGLAVLATRDSAVDSSVSLLNQNELFFPQGWQHVGEAMLRYSNSPRLREIGAANYKESIENDRYSQMIESYLRTYEIATGS